MIFNDLFMPFGKSADEAAIELLGASRLPVVLYGATPDVADQIAKKLSVNHIRIDYVVFDEESPLVIAENSLLQNITQLSVNELNREISVYHVVVGFVKGYQQIYRLKEKFKSAQSVSYLSEIFDMEIITQDFLMENRGYLENFYNHLADQRSKDSFTAYLMSKIRQDMQFLPPIFDKVQYFPADIIQLSDNEYYMDCGAFTGDTIEGFLKATGGKYKRIWAMEPDRENHAALTQYVSDRKIADIEVINKGVYSFAGKLPFSETGNMLSMIDENAYHQIDVDTIDRIAAGNPVTFIKMDVEGAELQALKGAEQTICRYKPVLAISIYHKEHDLIDIPTFIKEIIPEYTFYFRVHKKLAIDTVLYAIMKNYARSG
ncbi:MAG: FkbM family methyltransferase, partial [Tannerella sp.]|jgi:FkbM family methyltransferase|nr:FkbM family methyltransferase [Tannerella sp.]